MSKKAMRITVSLMPESMQEMRKKVVEKYSEYRIEHIDMMIYEEGLKVLIKKDKK